MINVLYVLSCPLHATVLKSSTNAAVNNLWIVYLIIHLERSALVSWCSRVTIISAKFMLNSIFEFSINIFSRTLKTTHLKEIEILRLFYY